MRIRCYVVDEIMGSGKTTAAINFINESKNNRKFLFVTPYLSEVQRIKDACKEKNFAEPQNIGSKLHDIKRLLTAGRNIVSTHALFSHFDAEANKLVKDGNYTLILDEVADVVSKTDNIVDEDIQFLKDIGVVSVNQNGFLKWNNSNCCPCLSDVKLICDSNNFVTLQNKINTTSTFKVWNQEIFKSFYEVYILTYLFSGQIQKYYLDIYSIPYQFKYIGHNYKFTDNENERPKNKLHLTNKIHICERSKLNMIGQNKTALSKGWYNKATNEDIEQLKKNIYNYFFNVMKSKSKNNLWTTFKSFRSELEGKGYSKGFAPCNIRASNDFRERNVVVYPLNIYVNPCVYSFFQKHGMKMDIDKYALSEMIQFIWRSAIRDGKDIWVYIPSSRMRQLLKDWIAEVDNKK
jgi:hypothetical protein